MTPSILITGAGGYLGKALVDYLRAAGVPVTCCLHSKEERWDGDVVHLDLNRDDHVASLAGRAKAFYAMVHLAGYVDIRFSGTNAGIPLPGEQNTQRLWQTNTLATINLAEQVCLPNRIPMLFASSQTVYGMPAEGCPLTEDFRFQPLEHYAASKAAAETSLELLSRRGLTVCACRIPGIYGGRRKSGIVWDWLRAASSGKPILVNAQEPIPFDIIHIEDVLGFFGCAIRDTPMGHSRFNVSTGEWCSLHVLARDISDLCGVPVEYTGLKQPLISLSADKAFHRFAWKARPRRERLLQMLEGVRHEY